MSPTDESQREERSGEERRRSCGRRVTDKGWWHDTTLKAVLVILVMVFTLLVVLEIQINRRNAVLDGAEQNIEDIEEAVNDLNVAVTEVRDIALTFREDPNAEPSEFDQQLQEVFRQVAEIHAAIVQQGN